MQRPVIRKITARKVHGWLDIDLDLFSDMNVLYGQNGCGKTTILHILTNLVNGSYDRFAFLNFESIKVETTNGESVSLSRTNDAVRVTLPGGETREVDTEEVRRKEFSVPLSERTEWLPTETPGPFASAKIAYFPAFRSMIEAWYDERRRIPRAYMLADGDEATYSWGDLPPRPTLLARQLFGRFVPDLHYPSMLVIQDELARYLRSVSYRVATRSQDILSRAFVEAFDVISSGRSPTTDNPEEVLSAIRGTLDMLDSTVMRESDVRHTDVYAALHDIVRRMRPHHKISEDATNVLSVYREALEGWLNVQISLFQPFERFVDAVNDFLENKRIRLDKRSVDESSHGVYTSVLRVAHDSGVDAGLLSLSSGERQIVSMLYAATYLGDRGNIVLIDEPEISLHVDWQRKLLRKMSDQLGERQIIVATHSPEVGADWFEKMLEVRPSHGGQ